MWDIIRSVSVDVPSKHRKILSVFITKKEFKGSVDYKINQ